MNIDRGMHLDCVCHPGTSRRGFLGAVGAMGALAAAGCATSSLRPGPQRIDVHHHISPPPWVAALKKSRLDSPPVNDWTPRRSLDEMDRGGVATAMTSPTLPGVGFLGPQDAAAVARASNEYARRLGQDHPGRFGQFALLPMPHVDETLKEIAYALDVLKCDGVAFMTSYGDRYLGDPAFAPVMDELHRRKATAYTHPNEPSCCRNLAGMPAAVIEWGTDTTRAIASLIFSGTSARCKDINFIFSHGGGTLGALTERFTVWAVSFPPIKARGFTGENVAAEIQRFHYDTAQVSNPIAMAAITRMVAASQILFGSDYPYRTAEEQLKGLAGIFGPGDLKMIERDNALRILPRLRG
jgi:predicted TIM-barrel fold metal-dependent hydrolase